LSNNSLAERAGADGVLLKTTNGGLNWIAQSMTPYSNFGTIDFVSKTSGWLAASSGVFKTTDAGLNWKHQSITQPTRGASGMSFVDSSYGWTCGGSYLNNSGWIAKTTDGGETWTLQEDTLRMDVIRISFADRNNGCAVGSWGRVLWTTNGGATWERNVSATGAYIYGVTMIDESTAIATAEGGSIVRTTNAGKDWQRAKSGGGGHMLAISMSSRSRGVVVGSHGLIRLTVDSGATWQGYAFPVGVTSMYDCTQYCYFRGVYFLNDRYGWAVGQGGGVFKHDFVEVETSHSDYGKKTTGENCSKLSVHVCVELNTAMVRCAGIGKATVRVMDSQGSELLHIDVSDIARSPVIPIALSSFCSGLYYVVLSNDVEAVSTMVALIH